MDIDKRGARAGQLWLAQEEQRKSDEKYFADKLIEELEAGIFTIQELAEFAAYNAIRVEESASKAINAYGTWLALKSGGAKNGAKYPKRDKFTIEVFTHGGKLSNGGKAKSENDERSNAIREIIDGWEKLKASYKGEKIPRGTKQKYINEKLDVKYGEYKSLDLDRKNIENLLKY